MALVPLGDETWDSEGDVDPWGCVLSVVAVWSLDPFLLRPRMAEVAEPAQGEEGA